MIHIIVSFIEELNWIDWLIIVACCAWLVEGWRVGFVELISGFLAYAVAFWMALHFHAALGGWVVTKLGLSQSLAHGIGYIIILIIVPVIIGSFLVYVLTKILAKLIASVFNNITGSIVGVGQMILFITSILLVALAFPLSGQLRHDIQASLVSRGLLKYVDQFTGSVTSTIDEFTDNSISFLTIDPYSRGSIPLTFKTQKWELIRDEDSERQMYELISYERKKTGISPLELRSDLSRVASDYSEDMLLRRFFSHFDHEGDDVGYRLRVAHIPFTHVGENIAYVSTVERAHQGLMASENQKKIILDTMSKYVGIGIIDAGINGRMVTQIFTD